MRAEALDVDMAAPLESLKLDRRMREPRKWKLVYSGTCNQHRTMDLSTRQSVGALVSAAAAAPQAVESRVSLRRPPAEQSKCTSWA